MEWQPGGHLRINAYDLPTRDLSDARELSFVPVHGNGQWVAWDLPERFAVVYSATGAQAAPDATDASRGGLARLLGANRAGVLALLDEPRSTTQLAALTGLPVGAVGNHLRVLLDAGTVLRRRSGREVLYWRTSLGDGLVAAGFAERA
jgi:DNA-binding transcriptional ArsR family regulator